MKKQFWMSTNPRFVSVYRRTSADKIFFNLNSAKIFSLRIEIINVEALESNCRSSEIACFQRFSVSGVMVDSFVLFLINFFDCLR